MSQKILLLSLFQHLHLVQQDDFTITLSSSATASESGGGAFGILVRPVKATSTANFGSSGSRINLPTEVR